MEALASFARNILEQQIEGTEDKNTQILKKSIKSKSRRKHKEETTNRLKRQKRLSADQKRTLLNLPHKPISQYDSEIENLLKRKAMLGGNVHV